MKKLHSGLRVKVSGEYHWAKSQLATVADLPGWPRTVASLQGPLVFYWVNFDEPQLDAEGDGPYFGAEIDSRYLEPWVS